jgi:two-component system sensor histidine kinase AlgZ
MVLDAPDTEIVPLRRELDFAERYLALQQVRLGDRLELTFDVSGLVDGVGVPILLIQPLIENAVEHGVAARRGAGGVAVRCAVTADRVTFEIRDDGPGLPDGFDARHTGRIGIATTAARLEAQFGADHRFDVRDHPDGGVVARVEVPITEIPA